MIYTEELMISIHVERLFNDGYISDINTKDIKKNGIIEIPEDKDAFGSSYLAYLIIDGKQILGVISYSYFKHHKDRHVLEIRNKKIENICN